MVNINLEPHYQFLEAFSTKIFFSFHASLSELRVQLTIVSIHKTQVTISLVKMLFR